MPELTEAQHELMNRCAAATLIEPRKHSPADADALYTTLILRSFLDVLRDQDPLQAQLIADLFNGPPNNTPWRLVKRAN